MAAGVPGTTVVFMVHAVSAIESFVLTFTLTV